MHFFRMFVVSVWKLHCACSKCLSLLSRSVVSKPKRCVFVCLVPEHWAFTLSILLYTCDGDSNARPYLCSTVARGKECACNFQWPLTHTRRRNFLHFNGSHLALADRPSNLNRMKIPTGPHRRHVLVIVFQSRILVVVQIRNSFYRPSLRGRRGLFNYSTKERTLTIKRVATSCPIGI